MERYKYWKQLKGIVTPGGDPAWYCPLCNSNESIHVYGVENSDRGYKDKCPACGIELKYPWENLQ